MSAKRKSGSTNTQVLKEADDMSEELQPRIVVFGVGGAGGNAVDNMIDAKLQGVEFVVANTDAQALRRSKCENRIQLGLETTQGLGAGARPEVGAAAAEESADEIALYLDGAHMVFIAAGMGGGTGTGSAPVISRLAQERGILTVGVVTKPFGFEGRKRMKYAEQGLGEMEKQVDTLIVIPNQNLFKLANEKTTIADAFQMADQVLYSGVRGITDLMVMPGLINLDFADVRTVMREKGKAMMGTGEVSGERRAVEAAKAAIANPLLDEVSLKSAKSVLINITGGMDMTLFEAQDVGEEIRSQVDENCEVIYGSTFDETLDGAIRVSIVATGIDSEQVPARAFIQPPVQTKAEQLDMLAAEKAEIRETIVPAAPVETPVPVASMEAAPEPVRAEPVPEERPRPKLRIDDTEPYIPSSARNDAPASQRPSIIPPRSREHLTGSSLSDAGDLRPGLDTDRIPADAVLGDRMPRRPATPEPERKSSMSELFGWRHAKSPEKPSPFDDRRPSANADGDEDTSAFGAAEDDMMPAFLRRSANR